MNTKAPEQQDIWSLLHDLIFAVPQPLLVIIEYAAAILVIVALAGLVLRIWKGDRFELGPVKIERSAAVVKLELALESLSKDDKLKANVLWMFRDRLNEANRIVNDRVNETSVRKWCGEVLTDIATALSRGGHDRHRASLWIQAGNELHMYSGTGFRQEAVDNATLPLTSIAGNVLRTGTSHNSSNVAGDDAFFPKPRSGRPYQSLLSVPIKTATGRTIAALCIDAEARGYFDRDDEFFAGCFADLIALLVAQIISGDEI